MSYSFKICTSCTPQYQEPVGKYRRKCPKCGARGQFAFRKPTLEEIDAANAARAKKEAFIQELLSDESLN